MPRTIFILAGGNDQKSTDYGYNLSKEIAKHVSNPKILSCFFASPRETWEEKVEDWKSWFSDHFTQLLSYAYAEPESFLEQIDAADVIYFHGGDTRLLLDVLPNAEDLKRHFEGKVIVGSSAGANMLAHYYWSSARGVMGEGKGILDINTMVHYGALNVGDHKRTFEDWKREEAELEKVGGQPVTRLPEGRFIIVERKGRLM